MRARTEIINSQIVNFMEELACYLRQGDLFRKPMGRTQYRFEKFLEVEKLVICENMDTHQSEQLYCNSPVLRMMFL
jgi:hypothetical protein